MPASNAAMLYASLHDYSIALTKAAKTNVSKKGKAVKGAVAGAYRFIPVYRVVNYSAIKLLDIYGLKPDIILENFHRHTKNYESLIEGINTDSCSLTEGLKIAAIAELKSLKAKFAQGLKALMPDSLVKEDSSESFSTLLFAIWPVVRALKDLKDGKLSRHLVKGGVIAQPPYIEKGDKSMDHVTLTSDTTEGTELNSWKMKNYYETAPKNPVESPEYFIDLACAFALFLEPRPEKLTDSTYLSHKKTVDDWLGLKSTEPAFNFSLKFDKTIPTEEQADEDKEDTDRALEVDMPTAKISLLRLGYDFIQLRGILSDNPRDEKVNDLCAQIEQRVLNIVKCTGTGDYNNMLSMTTGMVQDIGLVPGFTWESLKSILDSIAQNSYGITKPTKKTQHFREVGLTDAMLRRELRYDYDDGDLCDTTKWDKNRTNILAYEIAGMYYPTICNKMQDKEVANKKIPKWLEQLTDALKIVRDSGKWITTAANCPAEIHVKEYPIIVFIPRWEMEVLNLKNYRTRLEKEKAIEEEG